ATTTSGADANCLNGKTVKIMRCPSDPRSQLVIPASQNGGVSVALTGYYGVSGRNRFKEALGQDGILYVNAGVRMVQISDGTSNTRLVGERPPSSTLNYGWMWAGSGDSPYFGETDVVLGVRELVLCDNSTPANCGCPGAAGCPTAGQTMTGAQVTALQASKADFYRP